MTLPLANCGLEAVRQIKLQQGLPLEVRMPNALTARRPNPSKAGKNVKRFGSKMEPFAELGL